MKFLIRLAGVQLGPYSEEQVRQHLADGLLSLTDSAQREGMTDWAPLGDLLGDALPPQPETASELGTEAPAPPAALAPEEEQSPEAQEPAPDSLPEETHLPARQSEPDEGMDLAGSKKTILLGPTAPVIPAGMGPISTSIATTSPLIPLNQTTKKVSRVALVKALSVQTSPLPAKPIKAPPRPPVTASGAKPAPKPTAPPLPANEFTAKTVPMRSTPAAPPLPSMLPTTTPLPTRLIAKSELESALGKASAAKPELPPRGPSQATPPPSELEVPTVRLPPPKFKPDEPPAAKPPEKPKPVHPPAASPPMPKPPEPKPPRRWLPRIITASAVLAALTIYYVWSPYHAAASLKAALDAGDGSGMAAAIDFPTVRDSLKAQIKGQVWDVDEGRSKRTPEVAAMDDAASLLNNSIDTYVTPEGIAGLVKSSDAGAAKGDQSRLISPDAAAKILTAFNAQPVDNEGLASFGDFVIDRGAAMLHLRLTGLGWKLKRVDLRPDLATRAADGSSAPLLAPVLDTYLDRGRAKAKNGDAKGAIADFSQVISIDPRSSTAYNERATVRASTGDPDGAIKDFTQALAIDPLMAAAYNGRGNAKSAKNDPDGAIADFTQAIHFDPTLATAYESRGNARIAQNDTDGAISDFTQAISIDPTLASAYSDRGFARQANGNSEGAIADYTQALALKPKTARTYFNRAVAQEAQGNLDAAIVDLNHALDFDPKLADAYFHRGNAKSTKTDPDGAISDYTQALALNPQNAQAFNNRGLAHQVKGDLDAALADYTQALALDPKIASSFLNRAVIEAARNDLDGAIADSTQALYIDSKSAQAYLTRGFAKLTKGNLDGAFTDLKTFCDLAPHDHDADHARLYLWLIAKAQNSGAEADQDLSTALENNWNSTPDDILTETASFLLSRTNEPDYIAAAPSSDAKTDQAQHCLVWYFTGMKRALMGDKKGAIDAFHQCVASDRKDFVEYALAQAELQALEPVAPTAAPSPAPPAPPKSAKTD